MSNEIVSLGGFNGTEIKAWHSDQFIDATAICEANKREWRACAQLESAKRFRAA